MNKTVFWLGFATLFGFGLAGFLVVEFFQEQSFVQMISEGSTLPHQLWIGGFSGLIASMVALFIISQNFFENEKAYYSGLVSKLNISLPGIVFVSVCAGIGEEVFFRAGIQPFLGIGWTSFLFVLLHGYLNPKNLRISLYGVVMVLIVAGFGLLFELVGIFSAIVAHAVFDIVLFWKLAARRP